MKIWSGFIFRKETTETEHCQTIRPSSRRMLLLKFLITKQSKAKTIFCSSPVTPPQFHSIEDQLQEKEEKEIIEISLILN